MLEYLLFASFENIFLLPSLRWMKICDLLRISESLNKINRSKWGDIYAIPHLLSVVYSCVSSMVCKNNTQQPSMRVIERELDCLSHHQPKLDRTTGDSPYTPNYSQIPLLPFMLSESTRHSSSLKMCAKISETFQLCEPTCPMRSFVIIDFDATAAASQGTRLCSKSHHVLPIRLCRWKFQRARIPRASNQSPILSRAPSGSFSLYKHLRRKSTNLGIALHRMFVRQIHASCAARLFFFSLIRLRDDTTMMMCCKYCFNYEKSAKSLPLYTRRRATKILGMWKLSCDFPYVDKCLGIEGEMLCASLGLRAAKMMISSRSLHFRDVRYFIYSLVIARKWTYQSNFKNTTPHGTCEQAKAGRGYVWSWVSVSS